MDWTSIMSVSVFAVLVTSEIVISSKRQLELYKKEDTYANIALGFITFLTKVGTKGAIYFSYLYFYQFALLEIPESSVFWFIVAFCANDLMFYWYHRISHTTRFFWALHVAHHSSEKLNITTALRGNFVNNLFHAVFWIPLVLIGFHPLAIITADAFSYFYQLWLHTTIIPKLGPIEILFNTPSHHRVHHGSNPQYLDKNYAAVLIVWDKIFGTFEPEDEEVNYGLTKPVKTFNPVRIAFDETVSVFRAIRNRKSWSEKFRELWRKPY